MSVASIPFKLTVAGQDAAFNLGAIDLNVTHVQLGSGNRTPNGNEVALVTPQEYSVISGHFEVSVGQHRIAAVVAGSASAYSVSEIGLWSGVPGDVGSVLVFYWSLASSYIAVKSASVDFNFETDIFFGGVVPGNITIVVDTQFNALAMLAAHEADPHPHIAYLRRDDQVSQAVAEAGVEEIPYAWTPLRVKQAIMANMAIYPPGSIQQFAEYPLPAGWLEMIPNNVSRTTYANLFAKIGTRYGDGDGTTTFGLPAAYSILESFVNSTNMLAALFDHTATLLPDGRILVTGGANTVQKAETYFGTISGNGISWVASTAGSNLPMAIYEHTATLLPDGRVLIVGGNDGTNTWAETYFGTITGNAIAWVAGTALLSARSKHTETLLPDGRLLITGGVNTGAIAVATTYFGTITGNTIAWVAGTALSVAKYGHTANLLPDGRMLIIGGTDGSTAKAETYFGAISGNVIAWDQGKSLPYALAKHTTNLLKDGRIIITGGQDTSSVTRAETYFGIISGSNIAWLEDRPLLNRIFDHAVTLLPDGRLLITGGLIPSAYMSDCYFAPMLLNGIKT